MYQPQITITIIEGDKLVIIDHHHVPMNVGEYLDKNIWAIQWHVAADKGEIEFNTKKPNQIIDSLEPFQELIDLALAKIDVQIEAHETAEAEKQTVAYQLPLKTMLVVSEAQTIIDDLILGYPTSELLSFDKQETQARSYLSGSVEPFPFIERIALERGMALDELALRIVQKADAYSDFSSQVFGQRQKICDELKLLAADSKTTADDIINFPIVFVLD